MSIASEITRINNNIASAYTQVSAKGGTLPATQNSANLATAIASISGGSSSHDWSAIGYTGEPSSIQKGYNYAKNIYDNWDSSITTMYDSSTFKGIYDKDKNLLFFPLVDTSNVTNMQGAFNQSRLTYIPLINTSKVTNFQSFLSDTGISEIPLFDTAKATNMQYMLSQTLIETIPSFDTSRVTYFNFFASTCPNLANVPILDTSKVIGSGLNSMFKSCPNLTNQSLNNIMKMCINATSYTGTKTLKYVGLSAEQATVCMTLSNYQDFLNAGWTTGY